MRKRFLFLGLLIFFTCIFSCILANEKQTSKANFVQKPSPINTPTSKNPQSQQNSSSHPSYFTWGGSNHDEGRDITVGADGFIYTVGRTQSFGAVPEKLVLVKWDATGNILWNRTWNSPTSGYSVTTGSDGGIYTVGNILNSHTHILLKWDTAGNILWNRTSFGVGLGVVSDNNGSIYTTGWTNSFGAGESDLFLVKWNTEGRQLWYRTWGYSGWEAGWGVTVDNKGNIYTTGHTRLFNKDHSDLLLVKWDTEGQQVWNSTWGGSEREQSYGVAVARDGSIYTTGNTKLYDEGEPILVLVKWNSTGQKLWHQTWNGSTGGEGVVISNDESIYTVGTTPWHDLVLVKWDTNGTWLGIKVWGDTTSLSYMEKGFGVAVNSKGTIFCVGSTNSFGAGIFDLVLVVFSPVNFSTDPPPVPTASTRSFPFLDLRSPFMILAIYLVTFQAMLGIPLILLLVSLRSFSTRKIKRMLSRADIREADRILQFLKEYIKKPHLRVIMFILLLLGIGIFSGIYFGIPYQATVSFSPNPWQPISSKTYPKGKVNTIDFVDSDHGWLGGSRGLIMVTTDGGQTWTKQYSGTNDTIRALDFVNTQVGVAIKEKNSSYILVTQNGGKNWTTLGPFTAYYPSIGREGNTGIGDVVVCNEYTAWALGIWGRFFKIDIASHTWKLFSHRDIPLTRLTMLNSTYGWATGPWGNIAYTHDGWQTCKRQTSGVPDLSFSGIFFWDTQKGWVVGTNNIILGTTDGGVHWHVQYKNAFSRLFYIPELFDIYFISEFRGWAVGYDGIFYTENGGRTWFNYPNTPFLDQITFANETHGWATSYWNKNDLMTSTGGHIGISEEFVNLSFAIVSFEGMLIILLVMRKRSLQKRVRQTHFLRHTSGGNYCPACGNRISGEVSFCGACGVKLLEQWIKDK
ncbi:MAG: YCF48-related protein [Candidatus Hodarchaeota archaeon]